MISVIVPAWNEEQRIEATVNELVDVLTVSSDRWELLIVDDGSTDGTVAVCQAIAERVPELRVICSAPNRGKGHAVRVGMLLARGTVRVMCDADGSMSACELEKLTAPIAEGRASVVIGSRRTAGGAAHARPMWRRAWSRVAHFAVQHRLVSGVRDIHSGYKAFAAEAAQTVFARATLDGWAFDLEILALAQRLGFGVLEVGIQWTDDQRSRVQPLRDLGKVLVEAIALDRKLAHGVKTQGLRRAG